MNKHHFLLRRLHSLSGILPIGVFLIAHLTTNSTILWGSINSRATQGADPAIVEGVGETTFRQVGTFQHEVTFINESVPFLILLEITLWLSIGFHAVLGVYYAKTGKSNTKRYEYQSNWRYTLQRVSGYIGILFIFYHIATLRWGWTFLVPGGTKWDHQYASSTLAMALRGSESGDWTIPGVAVSLFYLVGVTLLVFHFANGLWTAAITWGLTVTARAQRNWGYVCTALGAGLMLAGWGSLFGFLFLDIEAAHDVETELLRKKQPAAVGSLHSIEQHLGVESHEPILVLNQIV
jgi:succinate dehydrogenase / fumarate reductase cytochrome b subunit